MGFSKQEYWSGLPFPSLGDLPNPGIEPSLLHCRQILYHPETSLVIQTVKNLPAMRKPWVQSLGQEDSLEEGMVTHSSILAWRIPLTEEPGGLQSMM